MTDCALIYSLSRELCVGPRYDLGFRFVAAPDSPYFKPRIEEMNRKLAALSAEGLTLEGFCALRMYTGPCYYKCACTYVRTYICSMDANK